MLKKVQIFKALDIEIKKQKGPASLKDAYKGHHSLKEELSQSGISVIAEVAGGSPLRGQVRDNYRPSTHARSLLENGARAISVATDRFLYWGDDRHLPEVRSQAKVPLLRRDFIFEEYQIEESKILGADAIFLMACLLEPDRLRDLHKLATAKSLDVIFEVFEESDLQRALEAGAEIICVVGRDMDTWEPSFDKALELLKKVPEDRCFRLVEAGITTQAQIRCLDELGVQGVILGEVFLDEFYPGKRLAQILAGIEPARKAPKIRPKLEESLTDTDMLEVSLSQEDLKKPASTKAKGGEKAPKKPKEEKVAPEKAASKKASAPKEKKTDDGASEKKKAPEKKLTEKKTPEKQSSGKASAGKKDASTDAPAKKAPAKKGSGHQERENTELLKKVPDKKATPSKSGSQKKDLLRAVESKKGDASKSGKESSNVKTAAKKAEK